MTPPAMAAFLLRNVFIVVDVGLKRECACVQICGSLQLGNVLAVWSLSDPKSWKQARQKEEADNYEVEAQNRITTSMT